METVEKGDLEEIRCASYKRSSEVLMEEIKEDSQLPLLASSCADKRRDVPVRSGPGPGFFFRATFSPLVRVLIFPVRSCLGFKKIRSGFSHPVRVSFFSGPVRSGLVRVSFSILFVYKGSFSLELNIGSVLDS